MRHLHGDWGERGRAGGKKKARERLMRAPAGRNSDLASQRRQYERDLRSSPWLFLEKKIDSLLEAHFYIKLII